MRSMSDRVQFRTRPSDLDQAGKRLAEASFH